MRICSVTLVDDGAGKGGRSEVVLRNYMSWRPKKSKIRPRLTSPLTLAWLLLHSTPRDLGE
jgi:hypothetical protein